VVQNLEDSLIPVAVTAFDLQTMSTLILTSGSMALAARASATFPGVFQPVGCQEPIPPRTTTTATAMKKYDYALIDGGIQDTAGIMGLMETIPAVQFYSQKEQPPPPPQVIVHLCIGPLVQIPWSELLRNLLTTTNVTSMVMISISMMGLPQFGPWNNMKIMGPMVYEMARQAMDHRCGDRNKSLNICRIRPPSQPPHIVNW
jgi:hypothetical protein